MEMGKPSRDFMVQQAVLNMMADVHPGLMACCGGVAPALRFMFAHGEFTYGPFAEDHFRWVRQQFARLACRYQVAA
jgi:hypothetical protein